MRLSLPDVRPASPGGPRSLPAEPEAGIWCMWVTEEAVRGDGQGGGDRGWAGRCLGMESSFSLTPGAQGTHQGLIPRGGKGGSPSSSSDPLCHRLGARGGLLPGWAAPVWPGQSFGGGGSCPQPVDTAATQERLSGLRAKRSHSPGTQPHPPP